MKYVIWNAQTHDTCASVEYTGRDRQACLHAESRCELNIGRGRQQYAATTRLRRPESFCCLGT